MRRLIGILIILLCGLLLLGGVVFWPRIKGHFEDRPIEVKLTHDKEIKKAEELLIRGKSAAALKLALRNEHQIDFRTENGRRWLNVLIGANEKLGNLSQLVVLYEAYPQSFERNENASLLVADGYILSGRLEAYQGIRKRWEGRERNEHGWFVLDADALLLAGKKEEGTRLLGSKAFPDAKDTARLIRLALLHAVDDPKSAWNYLTEAYHKDPQNPDIRLYRARFLETVGREGSAVAEYIAAVDTAPGNVFLKDQLAEYYVRQHETAKALQVWEEALKQDPVGSIWVKAFFWSKVIGSSPFNFSIGYEQPGPLALFIRYLEELPQGLFWDQEKFEQVPNGARILATEQAAFWLRLIDRLQRNDQVAAIELLELNRFQKASWAPQLEKALRQILEYRKTAEIAALPHVSEVHKGAIPAISFFEQLSLLTEGQESEELEPVRLLVASQEGFAAAFLAAKWNEAAIGLQKLASLPSSFPSWVAVELTEAILENRGPLEAIRFASSQPKEPRLSLLTAELHLEQHHPQEAIALLKPIAQDQEVGQKASKLLALCYIDLGQYEKARAIILQNEALAADLGGQELLARVALFQGDEQAADKVYLSIQDSSAEAKSYLARKAYAEKQWDRARTLTEDLLRQFPDNQLLQENLKKISQEQHALQTHG